MTGMQSLGADSLDKLKTKRPEFEKVIHDPNEMKDVYRYTFGYAKTKDQKCMDVDVACVLWTMMMGNQFPITAEFVRFLQEKKPVKVINRDQWQSFLEFVLTVSSDLSDYDETSAWPVLFDEFVEWKREEDQ
ncbi:DCN1, defective in cullin neddylation 1, domain-containing 4 [Fennellomyces sp. T-0311]|nr:DCN1, defective in cullin neddylation 1, domain-containing 4 [Fennellomyces sp. T-0311]